MGLATPLPAKRLPPLSAKRISRPGIETVLPSAKRMSRYWHALGLATSLPVAMPEPDASGADSALGLATPLPDALGLATPLPVSMPERDRRRADFGAIL